MNQNGNPSNESLYPLQGRSLWRAVFFCSVIGVERRVPLGSHPGSVMCKCGCRGAHAIQRLLEVIAWAFNVCSGGAHPSLDARGRPWEAGSRRALLANTP
eukprot:6216754-Pyramimonas_sp.AAC.1